ncbi:hypothetical protein [Acinetobacter sp. YH16032]|uniref:hypothetical protein n=1 Tax=Acinetobacter sp. YH16032 TaxID=2601181 RepID=UPI0015D28C5D|nr:hypothetical protein [Acinetobacter sp. YH16032]
MMQFKNKVKILGAKSVDFKPDDNSGRHYNHVSLYCEIPLKNTDGTAVGNACEVFNWQDNRNFVLLQNRKFPLEADITFEMVTSGKTTSFVVLNVELPNEPKV